MGQCSGGVHVVTFSSGTTNERCPDGMPCNCGAMITRWTKCPTCGHDELKFVPYNYPYSYRIHWVGVQCQYHDYLCFLSYS